jgi:hypothetical protein
MSAILTTLSAFYKCESALCSDKELAYRQWGSNDIMSRLPKDYFDVDSAEVLDWDTKDIFNRVPSEYALQTGRRL